MAEAVILGVAVVSAFLAGQWWGWRSAQQYLTSAQAVQQITNESFVHMKALVDSDSKSAVSLDRHTEAIQTFEKRLAVLGGLTESLAREVNTLSAARRSPFSTMADDDGDPTL